ncbi:ankyrin repeat domain-containing protein [Rhodovulum sp. DZ06]|uniref:ankyrin repeat domain-containing protein n=1 Tax=Rhodovulum sp. DZ06 TaxID=3425126 RepID=UPI003D341601
MDPGAPAALLASMKWCGPLLDAAPADARATAGPFGETPLHVCAIRGDLDGARLLLDAGAKLDAPGEDGFPPLQEAAAQGHAALVRLPLERGADPDAPNDWPNDWPNDRNDTAAELASDPATRAVLKDWSRG